VSRGTKVRETYLGDSYDLVKRFWFESLRNIAPLYAHSRFVPHGIRVRYARVTAIPVLESPLHVPFGILLDPHTGIPLPSESISGATASHASLPFIVQVNETLHPSYIVCFDQSYNRSQEVSQEKQRHTKQEFLRQRGMSSFYYVSHAPFLFSASRIEILDASHDLLRSRGIPESRLDFHAGSLFVFCSPTINVFMA
jgi:hypothetical protein